VWERDAIGHEAALNADFVVLDLDPELCVGAAPYRNLLIEGDNFDALRYLRMTHAGQVKCICIDPPYNTGNRDFIYNDRFVDAEDSFRHSKWLEFMYRRLLLARDLLREDGVIFVNIGEEEMAHLSGLMDQVFPGMKVGTFVWRTRSGANISKDYFVSLDHEYVLCYANKGFSFRGVAKSLAGYGNPDNDPRGDWVNYNLTKGQSYKERPRSYYPLQNPDNGVWYPCNPDRVWAFSSKKMVKSGQKLQSKAMEQIVTERRILWPQNDQTTSYSSLTELFAAIDAGTAHRHLRRGLPELEFWVGKTIGFGMPRYKMFKSDLRQAENPISTLLLPASVKRTEVESIEADTVTILQTGFTSDGSSLLVDMLGTKDFPYPKPLSLIQSLVGQATGPDDLVVDFFAGSGTTGHAVLALNAEEADGNRQFILVSSTEATAAEPEKNVCRDITRRRLEKAVNGYHVPTKKGMKAVDGLGGSFAYLRTRRIPVGDLLDVEHAQLWNALQLLHLGELTPAPEKAPVWVAGGAELQLVYLPRATAAAVKQAAEVAESAAATVIYTWQPELVRQRLIFANIRVEKVPACLALRFGLKL
jgi:adenine-specific DNA-methyltransferase